MGANYYTTLGVGRECNEEELRKGYRKMAMKWHPQKNPNIKEQAETKFRDIAEAYDVLIDPTRRATYDQYGEEGLKNGIMELNAQYRGYQYVGDPFVLFQDFFGTTSPFSEALGGDFGLKQRGYQKKSEDALEIELLCTLKDLYHGTSKQVSVERTRLGPDGRSTYIDTKLFTVPVKRGWKAGTRLTFSGAGNHTHPKVPPGDLVFVVTEAPHDMFERVSPGNDLVYVHKLNLCDALTGHTVSIPMLNDTTLTVNVPEVAGPSSEKRLAGQGMPDPKDDQGACGDLIIKWDISFPAKLSESEKAQIKGVLAKN